MTSQIAMIISNQDLVAKVKAQLPPVGEFEFVTFSSIADFFDRGSTLNLRGIVADVKTMVTPSPYKTELLTLSKVFPFLRLRAEAGGQLTGSVANETYAGGDMWEAFLTRFVRPFPLRSLRRDPRQQKFIPIEYRFDSEPTAAYRRSYTYDVSSSGLYIIATDARTDVKMLWLRMASDLNQEHHVMVVWSRLWEQCQGTKPAGFGLRLKSALSF